MEVSGQGRQNPARLVLQASCQVRLKSGDRLQAPQRHSGYGSPASPTSSLFAVQPGRHSPGYSSISVLPFERQPVRAVAGVNWMDVAQSPSPPAGPRGVGGQQVGEGTPGADRLVHGCPESYAMVSAIPPVLQVVLSLSRACRLSVSLEEAVISPRAPAT
ncbi:hypothetical protein AALO_G00038930 [Alosa alosa]|uniref:Uncharacterized protein n=1 Tax=Alosa alosa TaxID=278164 RepID=A0AAV6H7L1_9TELE|nr:hypothetical protein AALO_G00038930 [Alosa alosa]